MEVIDDSIIQLNVLWWKQLQMRIDYGLVLDLIDCVRCSKED